MFRKSKFIFRQFSQIRKYFCFSSVGESFVNIVFQHRIPWAISLPPTLFWNPSYSLVYNISSVDWNIVGRRRQSFGTKHRNSDKIGDFQSWIVVQETPPDNCNQECIGQLRRKHAADKVRWNFKTCIQKSWVCTKSQWNKRRTSSTSRTNEEKWHIERRNWKNGAAKSREKCWKIIANLLLNL